MKGIELIEQYPKASEVVLEWYKNKMKDSLNISTLSEDIKESFSDYIIGLDHISIMIDNKVIIIFIKVNLYFQKYFPQLIVLDKIQFELIKKKYVFVYINIFIFEIFISYN